MDKKILALGGGGFFIGAFIGYILRPAALLIGQLPFKHVITRGATLKGVGKVHLHVAQTSFTYLVIGGLIGAVLGIIIAKAAGKK